MRRDICSRLTATLAPVCGLRETIFARQRLLDVDGIGRPAIASHGNTVASHETGRTGDSLDSSILNNRKPRQACNLQNQTVNLIRIKLVLIRRVHFSTISNWARPSRLLLAESRRSGCDYSPSGPRLEPTIASALHSVNRGVRCVRKRASRLEL
jgi:hypothetical protein